MIKRGILFAGLVLLLFLVGCTNKVQVSETPQEPVQEETNRGVEEATPLPAESQPMEGEANNLTDITPQKQDVIVNQPAIQETKVQEPKCSREFSPQFNAGPYYEGPLFDDHFHMPPAFEDHDPGFKFPVMEKDITLSQIVCSFDKEKVRGAITFNMWEFENLEQSIQDLADMKKQLPVGIHLFLAPLDLQAEELEEVINSHKGVFEGFGEIAFYHDFYSHTPPDAQEVMEIYNVAARHNLIVMMHPDGRQQTNVENAVRKNPDVKFLIHGPEAEDYITDLMEKYPNVYYSLDAILIRLPRVPGALSYMVSGKEEFKLKITQNFDGLLNDAVKKWKNRIEQHPDRFMWGTDRALDWHFDEETSILFEEFARAFTGRLSPEVQEKYAYQNAEDLLQKR